MHTLTLAALLPISHRTCSFACWSQINYKIKATKMQRKIFKCNFPEQVKFNQIDKSIYHQLFSILVLRIIHAGSFILLVNQPSPDITGVNHDLIRWPAKPEDRY